jgi:hemolysin activation/secretion protein
MFQRTAIALASLLIASMASSVELPSGGSLLQQMPPAPTAPKQQTAPIKLYDDELSNPAESPSEDVAINVKELHIEGATILTDGELRELARFSPGVTSLRELELMAHRITREYRARGYFLAQAYLPEQKLDGSVATIRILEGQYGNISLHNTSLLDDSVANNLLAALQPLDVVERTRLEERLLLLTDLPGVQVQSTLSPGQKFGQSDLLIDVDSSGRITGNVDYDNEGNYYSEPNRIGFSANWNEPSGYGDALNLRLMSSGAGMSYERLFYLFQTSYTQWSLSFTNLDYALVHDFALAQATGWSQVAGLNARRPLLRTRNANVYIGSGYELKMFHDANFATTSDKTDEVINLTLSGDSRSSDSDERVMNFTLRLVHGHLNLRSAPERFADSQSTHTDGDFDKAEFNASSVYQLAQDLSFYASLNGQYAFKNLDISEKISLGGASGVRAYPSGEVSADSGCVLNLELRKNLRWGDQRVQGSAFLDFSAATIYANRFIAGAPNENNLRGAGLGLSWLAPYDTTVRIYLAAKLDKQPATSAPDADYRIWLQAVKYF